MSELAARFGDRVHVAVSPLLWDIGDLPPEERALCAGAVEKRRREVAAGRVLARRLFERLGLSPEPLLRDRDRAPIWPEGIVGSISHTDDLCVVAIARKRDVETLGVDVEMKTPLTPELYPLVLVESEMRWLASCAASEQGELAKLIFSAKECAYKTQFPLTKKMLDFSEVALSIDRAAQKFEASILPGAGGFFVFEERHLITGMMIPATGSAATSDATSPGAVSR